LHAWIHADGYTLDGVLDLVCQKEVRLFFVTLLAEDLQLVLDLHQVVEHEERVAQSLRNVLFE